MSALFRILYAAHANGTHHKLALDALQHMEREDREAWSRVFLKYATLYLEGSKAPDVSFKDFKNHVLHVAESYWGGAPEKVEAWYAHTVKALSEQRWADAVYAAGVLSHYATDPIHPFHTGQTEAENSIHRACEWTINRTYNDLRKIGEAQFASLEVKRHDGHGWLKETVCDGAEFSHRYYEKLIAHYDINRGAVRPEEGLDEVGRTIVAELLIYAAKSFGLILDRAIAESGVAAPDVPLSLETAIAALNMPAKWIEKKLTNAEDKAIVQAMYDELKATGKVEHSLPEDDRVIRDLHKREVLDRIMETRLDKRAVRVPDGDPAEASKARRVKYAQANLVPPAASAGHGDAADVSAKPQKPARRIEIDAEFAPEIEAVSEPKSEMVASEAKAAALAPTPLKSPDPERRYYLTAVDDLEKAPSIGPKMAARFAGLGIKTVADFLAHSAQDMAELLDDKRLKPETLGEWQHQAELVLEIAGLRGTHAQLITGAGYRYAADVAAASPVDFAADILKFAASEPGKRVLREGNAPDIEKIKSWVESAKLAKAA